jgi:hypothetical protein
VAAAAASTTAQLQNSCLGSHVLVALALSLVSHVSVALAVALALSLVSHVSVALALLLLSLLLSLSRSCLMSLLLSLCCCSRCCSRSLARVIRSSVHIYRTSSSSSSFLHLEWIQRRIITMDVPVNAFCLQF